MTNGLLKSDAEAALDDVTARCTELIELWSTLDESGHTGALHEQCGSVIARFADDLDQLMSHRRSSGELPAIGNLERAQLEAAMASIESFLPGSDQRRIAAQRIATAAEQVQLSIDAARSSSVEGAILSALRTMQATIEDLLAQLAG